VSAGELVEEIGVEGALGYFANATRRECAKIGGASATGTGREFPDDGTGPDLPDNLVVDDDFEVPIEDQRDRGRAFRLAKEVFADAEVADRAGFGRVHDLACEPSLQIGLRSRDDRNAILSTPRSVRPEHRLQPQLGPRKRSLFPEATFIVVEPMPRKRARTEEPRGAASVAPIVSSMVVQIVNGRVRTNGHRTDGRITEKAGRFPTVCTNVAVLPTTSGECRISGLRFVGNMTRNGPAVIGVKPITSPSPVYPQSQISPSLTSIQARKRFAKRNSPRRRIASRSTNCSGGGGS
jgi:hypothetical protein